jgi:integrase
MLRGKRIHRRLPADATKSGAKEIEAEIRRAAAQQRAVVIPGDPLLTEIMGIYMSHADTLRSPDTAKFHALRCGPWCEGRRASEADQVAAKMIDDMRAHYKPATINRSLGALTKALSLAYRKHVIPENYGQRISRLPENNERHNYLSIGQVSRLAECCSKTVRVAVWIALLTGCRRGEILKLRHEDIQGERLRILAGNTKTLRERMIPIVPALRPWLDNIPLAITADGLKNGFVRAARKAGVDAHFHDLRHSCASLLINMGIPLEVIRDILGHTTIKTTERYAHLLIERQTEALTKLSDAVQMESCY